MSDYCATSPGDAICSVCDGYCTAYVTGHGKNTEAVSDCHDAPATWQRSGETVTPDDLWVHEQ